MNLEIINKITAVERKYNTYSISFSFVRRMKALYYLLKVKYLKWRYKVWML